MTCQWGRTPHRRCLTWTLTANHQDEWLLHLMLLPMSGQGHIHQKTRYLNCFTLQKKHKGKSSRSPLSPTGDSYEPLHDCPLDDFCQRWEFISKVYLTVESRRQRTYHGASNLFPDMVPLFSFCFPFRFRQEYRVERKLVNELSVDPETFPIDPDDLTALALSQSSRHKISRVVVLHNDKLETFFDKDPCQSDFFDNDSFWSGSITWY